jgi:hypothetical protein
MAARPAASVTSTACTARRQQPLRIDSDARGYNITLGDAMAKPVGSRQAVEGQSLVLSSAR